MEKTHKIELSVNYTTVPTPFLPCAFSRSNLALNNGQQD